MIYMRGFLAIDKVARRSDLAYVLVCVDEDELHLHPLGDDALYEDGGGVADLDVAVVGTQLCESREVRRQLYEYAVGLYTAHSARNRLPGGEEGGVFFPGPKELLLRQKEPSRLGIDALYYGVDEIAAAESVARMCYSRDRKRIDGQKRGYTASDVGKCTEGLEMRDLDADDVAGDEG